MFYNSFWFVFGPFAHCNDVLILEHLSMDIWCCVIVPFNVFSLGKLWTAGDHVIDSFIKLATHSS